MIPWGCDLLTQLLLSRLLGPKQCYVECYVSGLNTLQAFGEWPRQEKQTYTSNTMSSSQYESLTLQRWKWPRVINLLPSRQLVPLRTGAMCDGHRCLLPADGGMAAVASQPRGVGTQQRDPYTASFSATMYALVLSPLHQI